MAVIDPEEPSAKSSQILDGALATFLALGFDGGSVDEIARRAKVSKPTVYNHFADKRALFVAVVRRECSLHSTRIFTVDIGAGGIEAQLLAIGRRLMDLALSEQVRSFFRLVVYESARFPELGRVFYDAGPGLGARRLSVLLAAAVGRGELAIDDVELAAHQFSDLCRADTFYRCLFGVVDQVLEDDADRIVAAAVSMFMKAYRV